MKILVVEDDFVSRNVMVGAVEKLGHHCLVAEDGSKGWELFRKEPCEVVLSDWMMPGLSGLELCRLVRGFESQSYCYFIMLSSLDKKHHILQGLEAGADDYLTKPLDFEQLQARLIAAQRVTSLHNNLLEAQAQAVLNSKLAAVGQLAAGVAHQINTPLGAVQLALESARRHAEKPQRVKDKIEHSLKAVKSIQNIVSQLLDSSRMAPSKRGYCDLNSVMSETIGLLESQLDQCDLEVVLCQEPICVAIPASELQQVVMNLLTNARDAVSANGASGKKIAVSTMQSDNMGILQVSDEGPGVPEHIRSRLFEPFFTTKPLGGGVGLGLPIVKNLVDLRDGQVRLVEEASLTCFEVRLPLDRN